MSVVFESGGHLLSLGGSEIGFIGTSPPQTTSSQQIQFTPGDYGSVFSPYAYKAGVNFNTDFPIFAASATGFVGFCFGLVWADLEDCTQATNRNLIADAVNGVGQFAGFQHIATQLNAIQTSLPGYRAIIYLNHDTQHGYTPPGSQNTDLIVPHYLGNAPSGNISVPNSFGSANTTAYTMGLDQRALWCCVSKLGRVC